MNYSPHFLLEQLKQRQAQQQAMLQYSSLSYKSLGLGSPTLSYSPTPECYTWEPSFFEKLESEIKQWCGGILQM